MIRITLLPERERGRGGNLLEKKGIITKAELLEEIKGLRARQNIKKG
jgi:hypothetical protein